MDKEKQIQKKKQRIRELISPARGKDLLRSAAAYLARLVGGMSEAFWSLVRDEGEREERGFLSHLAFLGAGVGVCFFFGVVALARFPLDVVPAGFALLASLGGGGKKIFSSLPKSQSSLLSTALLLFAFSGVLLSCLFLPRDGLIYCLAYLILFFVRAGVTGGRFQDSILSRVTLSASFATATGLLLSLLRGFTVNSVFGAVSGAIITPLLTYLMCGVYIYSAVGSETDRAFSRRRVYFEATVFTLYYLFLYSLRDAVILNFSLPFLLAVIATLATAKTRGALYGAAAGMIGGMALADPSVSPALAIGGFFSGLFFEYSGIAAMMIAFISSCGYSLFSNDFSSFAFFSADYLLALVLFFPLLRCLPGEERIRSPRSVPQEVMHRETVRRAREKLKNMSQAFSSLSEVFYTVSDTMKKPGLTETSRMVSDLCSQMCSKCALSPVCWGEKQSLAAGVTTGAAARLLTEGAVTAADFSQPFSSKCKDLDGLIEKINTRYEEMSGNFYKNNKTRLLAGEYSSVSRLLKSTAGDLDRELEYNPSLEIRAKKVLRALGIQYRRVAVFGDRELKIDVYGVALERVSLASCHITDAFGKEFACVFDAPGFLMFEESVVMRLRRKRKISLECAKSGLTKAGESVSGDSCLFFETERDYFYTLICDGMGSGREAAFTSRLSSIFIEKLMHCATPKNVTLEMLNAFLMAKTDETFTTVDLLEIDLLSADANFIKAGAAPSFVLRGDRLHRIESRTPPAGALYRMCAEQTTFRLREGDYIIQMSDGAEEGGDTAGWLIRLLTGSRFDSAAALCDCIFQKAKEKGAFRDDLSVSVTRIMNNK